ncbi:MAG: terpene cyclase/mutase family protein [Deltaproteobacteria bacterium]|nr:terpene cyclase/mutase family protein [Deltaproteobacteria bacterium]
MLGQRAIETVEQRAQRAAQLAIDALARQQQPDGHWAGDYGGPLFMLPGLVFTCEITGVALSEARRQGIVRYLFAVQNADHGWGLDIASHSHVFCTALNYIALRMLGLPADDARLRGARRFLRDNGGIAAIPTWGKFWLALLGIYRWEGVPPLLPELWLLPRQLPFHPANLWCHTRAVFLPMSHIYGRRLTAPITPLTEALRRELFDQPYRSIDWRALRYRVAESDSYTVKSRWLHWSNALQTVYERTAPSALRRRALARTARLIVDEDRSTNYLDIATVTKALHMLIAWFDDPQGEAFARHRERLDDYFWDGHDGTKAQGYNGSQFWDTAFACQAILDSGQQQNFSSLLERAHRFIDDNQVRANVENHRQNYRDQTAGAWPFSTAEQGWTVSDCTAKGVELAIKLAPLVQRPIDQARISQAVDLLLAAQNTDGGWSEYERRRGPLWLERFNAAEIFGPIMVAYSYVECTADVMIALRSYSERYPADRQRAIRRAIARGRRYIRSQQREDGSWYGSWGSCFCYGTWYAIEGLRAAADPRDGASIERGCRFLLDKQRPDGGWAESHLSCREERWVEHAQTQMISTAWALLALIAGECSDKAAIERGIAVLIAGQQHDGSWPREELKGVFNKSCMIDYDNYRTIMPLWALGRFSK